MSVITRSDEVNALSEQIIQGRCVLFIGSGISASYTDPQGRMFPGLPTGHDLLQELRRSREYVTADMSLLEALTMKYIQEGRRSLLDFVNLQISDSVADPLPAHLEISKLPISAVISTNWDLLLESALRKERIGFHVIVLDSDIPIFRPRSIPLVKLHGSIDRPDTIVATFDDMLDLLAKRPVLTSLLRILCAQGTLLFLGYSLDDVDFKNLYRGLRRELKDFMPVAYAVQRRPSQQAVIFWASEGVRIIDEDATNFLQLLNATILHHTRASLRGAGKAEEWMADPFLRSLMRAGTLATESQVIDGALQQVIEMLEGPTSLNEITDQVSDAIAALVRFRPHYQGLRALQLVHLPTWFPPNTESKERAAQMICEFLAERENGKQSIAERGAKLINVGDKILLYSQSTRVLEVINRWLRQNRKQINIELFLCECRPKSRRSFEDAFAFAEAIASDSVPITFVPDAAIAHLMATSRVTKVFLGAHNLIEFPDGSMSMTNTTGSLIIAKLASQFGIPVYVFAEEAKIFAPSQAEQLIATATSHPLAEEEIIEKQDVVFRDLSRSKNISVFNPGYDDIVSSDVPFILVTEKRCLEL